MPEKGRQIPILHTFEICDRVEVENGKKALYGLFDVIKVLSLPAIHPTLSVVLGFSRGRGHFKGRLAIANPSNREIIDQPFEFKLRNVDQVQYQLINIVKMPIFELGKHSLVAYIGRRKIGARTFRVNLEEVHDFSTKEIKKLLSQSDVIKKARVVLQCPKCKATYTFQLNLNPKQPIDKDARPFPPDSRFRCPNDDFEVDLTGIRLRLKKTLGRPLPKKPEG